MPSEHRSLHSVVGTYHHAWRSIHGHPWRLDRPRHSLAIAWLRLSILFWPQCGAKRRSRDVDHCSCFFPCRCGCFVGWMFWSFDHCDRWRWCRCGWIGRVGWVVKVLRLVRVQWKPPPPPGKVFWTSMWVDHGACRRRVVLPPVGPPKWLARSLRRRRRSSRRRRTKISWRLHRPARVFVWDERAGTRDERDVRPCNFVGLFD